MLPFRLLIILLRTGFVTLKKPWRDVSITLLHSSKDMRAKRLSAVSPALFTSASTDSCLVKSSSICFSVSSLSATSKQTVSPHPPPPRINSTVSSAAFRLARKVTTTSYPHFANSRLTARPIPRPPPVTSATCLEGIDFNPPNPFPPSENPVPSGDSKNPLLQVPSPGRSWCRGDLNPKSLVP